MLRPDQWRRPVRRGRADLRGEAPPDPARPEAGYRPPQPPPGRALTPWHVTEHLKLDSDGIVWERYKGGWHYRGLIDDAEVSPGLEPELAECRDLWGDRIDSRAEQLWAYQLKDR
jgi:hypothetical protein